MPDRSAYLQGANLGILIAVVIVVTVGGIVTLGPANQQLHRLRGDLLQSAAQLESWQAEFARFLPVAPEVRERWRASWLAFDERLKPAHGDAELTALIAEGLQGHDVRRLQVSRGPGGAVLAGGEEPAEMVVEPIVAGEPLRVRPQSVSVSFIASYEDVRQIVDRLQGRRFPARLDAIELKREFPDVSMQLELAYFLRVEAE